MSPPPVAIASGLAMVGAGLFLYVSRPRGGRALVLLALLVLWGVATIASALYTGAPDAGRAAFFAALTLWYTLPLPLLLLGAGLLLLHARLGRAHRLALAALAALTAAGLAAYALRPDLFIADVLEVDGTFGIASGPLQYVLSATFAVVEAGIALLAVRHAGARGPPLARQRATWVALAAGVVPLHAGAFFVLFIAAGPPPLSLFWARAVPTVLAGAVALFAFSRLAGGMDAATRRAGAAAALLLLALGAVDGLVGARRLQGFAYPGYETTTAIVRLVFAALLSFAVLRFGFADVGARGRALVARASRVALALVAAAGAAGLVALVVGRTPLGLGLAAAAALATPIALRPPIMRSGRALADRLLLPPSDPRAAAERARTYAAAVAAARGRDGRLVPEGEKLLAHMRLDLGISDQEHELLLSGVASREEERYRALQPLGRGSTAQVDLALDEAHGRRVVVKRFTGLRDPGAVLREARALASVRHPRVIPFLEVDRRGDDVHLVLAYAEGGSARQLLDRDGPLAAERATALTRDLLEGLEALHEAGIVHGDVKPENLLLDGDGRGVLGDFGSATWQRGADAPAGASSARFVDPAAADTTRAAEGSLSTMSPEAVRGAPPAPTRDVYAAGALLFRLLTGEHYVDLADASAFEARERILLDPPRLPHPRVPAALEAALRKALAKRPADRYQSAREMREALLTAEARAAG